MLVGGVPEPTPVKQPMKSQEHPEPIGYRRNLYPMLIASSRRRTRDQRRLSTAGRHRFDLPSPLMVVLSPHERLPSQD